MLTLMVTASRMCIDAQSHEMERLGHTMQARNPILDLTGFLYVGDETFFQVMEGEDVMLERLASRIKDDHRNREMRILCKERQIMRNFGKWHMKILHADRDVKRRPALAYDKIVQKSPCEVMNEVAALAASL